MSFQDDMRRLQDAYTRSLSTPEMTKLFESIESFRKSLPFTDLQKNIELIQRSFIPISKEFQTLQQSITELTSAFQPQFNEFNLVIAKLSQIHISNIAIPDEVYARLRELSSQLPGTLPNIEELQITESITAIDEQTPEQKMTWYNLLILLLTIWQSIFLYYSNYSNSLNYEQQMLEVKRQTALQEQLIDIEKERLRIEQDRIEEQKDLEEQFNLFVKFVAPLIPENPTASEADQ